MILTVSDCRHMVSMHGISLHGYTLAECRVLLFRHVFGGDCVSQYGRSHHNDRTACIHFSKGFHSEEEMSFSVFHIIASARCSQRSNDDLLLILQDLDIHSDFHVQHTRRQITRALQQQAKDFVRFKKLATCSNIFTRFESHSKATLLAIASAHGISVSRYTSDVE